MNILKIMMVSPMYNNPNEVFINFINLLGSITRQHSKQMCEKIVIPWCWIRGVTQKNWVAINISKFGG